MSILIRRVAGLVDSPGLERKNQRLLGRIKLDFDLWEACMLKVETINVEKTPVSNARGCNPTIQIYVDY